jgi:hypothetical protein
MMYVTFCFQNFIQSSSIDALSLRLRLHSGPFYFAQGREVVSLTRAFCLHSASFRTGLLKLGSTVCGLSLGFEANGKVKQILFEDDRKKGKGNCKNNSESKGKSQWIRAFHKGGGQIVPLLVLFL